MARTYSDPTPAWVTGAIRGGFRVGVDDPGMLVDESWTAEQKRRWSAQFSAYAADLQRRSGEQREAAVERGAATLRARASGPPLVRDVREGVRQGLQDLGGLGLRVADLVRPPVAGEEGLADTQNRLQVERERAMDLAGRGDVVPDLLQSGVRGASRSVTSGVTLAATGGGSGVVIGGFAASRANQAITEARDAGLTGDQAFGYVGRAALIEGAVAGVFEAMGLGGAEKLLAGGPVGRQAAREILRQTGAELVEENVTELLDAYNQARSRVAGPLTGPQAFELLKQTTVQTLLTMGAIGGYRHVEGNAQRDALAGQLAGAFGWDQPRARGVVDRAADRRGGDLATNLGREVQDEASLGPVGLATWATQNIDKARALAGNDAPSRADWDAAGLPRRSAEERARIAAQLRRLIAAYDEASPPAATTPTTPPAPPASSDASTAAAETPPAPPPRSRGEPVIRVTPRAPQAGGDFNADLLTEDERADRFVRQVTDLRTRVAARLQAEDEGELEVDFAGQEDQRRTDLATWPGLESWVANNPNAAAALAAIDDPTVEDFAQAGLPRPTEASRATAHERINDLLDDGSQDQPLVQPDATAVGAAGRAADRVVASSSDTSPPAAEAPPTSTAMPPAVEPETRPTWKTASLQALDAELRARRVPREEWVAAVARRGRLEAEATVPGSTDWRTADAETLRGLLEGFKVPKKDHAAVTVRLVALTNPVDPAADWQAVDKETLASLIYARAVHPDDMREAQARLKRLHDEARAAEAPVAEVPGDASTLEERPVAKASETPASDAGPGPEAATPSQEGVPAEGPGPAEEPSTAAEEPKATPQKARERARETFDLANDLAELLRKGEKIDWRKIQELANEAYGGTLADHTWQMQDAYESLELALNTVGQRSARTDVEGAKKRVAEIEALLDLVQAQTTRSADKDAFQQFSTPAHYAYAVTWVGNPRKDDVVLEPSGGTGSLATHARRTGVARVIGNELSPQRAALLARFAHDVFTEDAEQIHNILPARLPRRPTLVLMNPPFSAAGQRMKGKKVLLAGAKHVEVALELLEPGGRLVAIVGRGMSMEAPAYAAWWDRINGAYDVRANVEVSGKVYAKQGTEFETRVLVIDKTLPDVKTPVVTGSVNTIPELLTLLEEVRNDRPTVGAPDREAVGGPAPQPGGAEGERVAAGGAAAVAADARGGGAAGEGELPGGSGGVRPAEAAGNVGQPGGGVAAGRGASRRGPRGRTGRAAKPAPRAAAQPPAGAGAGLPAAERADVAPKAEQALDVKAADRVAGEDEGAYETYQAPLQIEGAVQHGTPLVESAAMASVASPAATYVPKIPKSLIEPNEKGEVGLSAAQINAIVYAGAMHQQTIPVPQAEKDEFQKLTGKPSPEVKRRGFFIGDGTGVGKGREAAGVILDNWNQGRKRAIWISENTRLLKDAVRDWTDLGGAKADLLGLDKVKSGEPITKGDGIVFGTYDTLGTSNRVKELQPGQSKPLTRVEQLAKWFGEDFDGVVIFDEAHNAGNAVETKGSRGKAKPSARALMMIELQRRLPNARVVYLSATGATQVANLAYAERLGLWGEGTEFASREAFVQGVTAGGVAAMELVARDMKAQGMYVSRTLSFKGVGYSRLTHALTPAQRQTYDTLADAWQIVLQNINEALELTSPSDKEGSVDPRQKSAALSAFWAAHQRFFNQVLTALQMPSVLESLREDLKAGRAPVIQIVNTLEASTERALAKLSEDEGELEELDITPRDALMQMVQNSFPVTQMEQYTDANGNVRSRPAEDSQGNPVLNQEAVKLRDALLDKLADIAVPDAPLDQIVRAFGPERVAEVTGRKRRVVEVKGKREVQNRTKAMSLNDVRAFMDGERDLLIFSQAGATGASYHADLRAKNQKPRRHYVLQAGWRADQAIQGLGRSHRSNQAQPPEFRLVETDLPGHRRFISTIARRLEQLGALSRGQRTAAGGGLFSESDNLEGTHAQDALSHLLKDIVAGKAEGIAVEEFEAQTGLELRGEEGGADVAHVKVTQFLNRLLSLKIDMQNRVFDAYAKRLDAAIEYARQTGTLDVGMETLRAAKIEKISERVIRTDKRTGATTSYVALRTFNPSERHAFEDLEKDAMFMRNERSGRSYIVKSSSTRTDEKGNVIDMFAVWAPSGKTLKPAHEVRDRYTVADRETVRAEWNDFLANMPDMREETVHLITGALLPVWSRLGSKPRVRRATTDAGERFLGRVVAEDDIEGVLGNLGVDHKLEAPTAERAQAILLQGGLVEFANGWTLRASRVRDEQAIEVSGVTSPADGEVLVGMGARKERMGFKNRYFFARGAGFAAPYARLVKGYDVARVVQGSDEERMFAPENPPPPPPSGGLPPRPRRNADGEPIQKVEVIDTIKRLWPGLSVRGPATFKRQFKTARALGWYTPGLGEMRTRDAYDVVTAIHELGHHLDREEGSWSRQHGHPEGIDAELTQLGRDLYGGRRPEAGYRAEGFAEFIRDWLTGATDLESRAPKLHAWFSAEYLPSNPGEAAKLRELATAVQKLLTQTPQQAIEAFMRPTQKGWTDGKVAAALASAESNWRDSALPLLRGMQETGADLSRLEPRHHPYMLATYYARSAGGRARHAALSHTVDLHGRENGKGLRDVLQPILDQDALKDFLEFMVAKRALLRYHAQGINPGISKEDAQAIVQKHEQRPGFVEAAEELTDFAHRALRPLVEAGAMTEDEFNDIVEWNPVYVPFLRQVENEGDRAGQGGRTAVNRVTKRGSNLPIHDPIDAMLMQYERIQQVAMQADVVRALVRFYDQQKGKAPFLGKLLSEVPAPQEAVRFSAEQVRKAILDAAGEDADTVDEALEEFWQERLTVFRPGTTYKGREKIVALVVDGRRRFFEVKDDLMPILEGVTQSAFLPGTIGAIVRGVTSRQRLGATGLNPAFGLIRNVLRDTLTAAITSDYHFHVPLWSTMVGTFRDLTNSDYARRYHAAGLDISGRIGQDLGTARELSQAVQGKRLRSWRAIEEGLREILSRFEVGPRLMEFQAAHEAGMQKWGDERDALVLAGAAAKDVTVNFARGGVQARKLNEVILFFNAAVQSADKLLRSVGALEAAPWAKLQDRRANAVRTVARGASFLTSVALLLYLLNRDDDWWKELPPHEKWGYLHVKLGDHVIRVPLPFEAGSVFGALPIAAMEETRSPGALLEALGVAAKGATPLDLDGLHGLMRNIALIAPLVDVVANEDWKGQPIVPETVQESRVPSDQYGPRTTGLARLIGAHVPGGGMSPAKIEHLLNGYTGGLYARLASALDTIMDPSAVRAGEPSTWPVAGTLFLRPDTSRVTGDFYDRLKWLRQRKGSKVATLEELGELGQAERLNRDLQELWQSRRASIASDASAAQVQEDAEAFARQAQDMIRAHEGRDRTHDRMSGLGALLYRATDPSAETVDLTGLEALSEQEALEAFRAEVRRRGDHLRPRTMSGGWTAFGRRQARLLRALRARPQPAAPSSAAGS